MRDGACRAPLGRSPALPRCLRRLSTDWSTGSSPITRRSIRSTLHSWVCPVTIPAFRRAGMEAAEHERDGLAGLMRDLDGTPVGRHARAAARRAHAACRSDPRGGRPRPLAASSVSRAGTPERSRSASSRCFCRQRRRHEDALSGRLDGRAGFLDGRGSRAGRPADPDRMVRARPAGVPGRRASADRRICPGTPSGTDALARPAAHAAAAVGSLRKGLDGSAAARARLRP